MNFIHAVWYFKDLKVDIKPSKTFSGNNRFYYFVDKENTQLPVILMSSKSIRIVADFHAAQGN